MAQGFERYPLAYVPDTSIPNTPVEYANTKRAPVIEYLGEIPTGSDQPESQATRGAGTAFKDAGMQVVKGAMNIAGAIPNLVSPEGESAKFFNEAAKFYDDQQSDYTRNLMTAAKQRIDQAAQTGEWDGFTTALAEYASEPALFQKFVLENAASFIPGLGAAKGVQMLGKGMALARGAAPAAAAATGIAAGVAGGRVANSALNAGGARQDAFSDIKASLMQQGMGEAEATRLAVEGSRIPAAVGGVAGAISGGTGLERGILGGMTRGGVRGFVGGTAKELGGELVEELSPKVATNLQVGDIDPSRKWSHQLGETAAQTIIASAPSSVLSGSMEAIGSGLPADGDNAIPAADIGVGPGSAIPNGDGIEGDYLPADPRTSLPNSPEPGATYDQNRPALPPGQPLLTGQQPMEGDVLGPETLPPGQRLLQSPAIDGTFTEQSSELARPALPAPEHGGPTERQIAVATGLLKHSPNASPDMLMRMMRMDQTMATMLFNHWQGKQNGQVSGGEATQAFAQGGQGSGADLRGSGAVAGVLSGPVSSAMGQSAEAAVSGVRKDVAVPAAGAPAVTPLDVQAHAAATSPFNATPQPTEAQKIAGNYAKGHVKFQGMDIAIENPAGSVRSGKDDGGREWQTQMQHHYGYIKGTVGRDKDHLDVFIKPGAQTARMAYVIDQKDPKTGAFDEHKIIFGADSEADARAIYQANYEQGWNGLGAITAMPMEGFKAWINSGQTKKPLAYKAPRGTPAAPKHSQAPIAKEDSGGFGKVGVMPNTAKAVSLADNGDGTATVMRGDEPFYDFDSGEPVTVPAGTTPQDVRKAVEASGAMTSKDRWFATKAEESIGVQVSKSDQIAGKPVWEGRAQPSVDASSSTPFADPSPAETGEKAAIPSGSNQTLADKTADSKEDAERFERKMRAAASMKPAASNDVQTTALRYVPFDTAIEIAREAVSAGVKPVPAQFHTMLDLTMDSADRLISGLKTGDQIAGKPTKDMSTETLKQVAGGKVASPAAKAKATKELAKRGAKKDALADIREFYTPGNVIHVDYWNTFDRVIEFKEGDLPGQWSVKVQQVVKDGDKWVPKDARLEPPRWHATSPGKDKVVFREPVQSSNQEPVKNETQAVTGRPMGNEAGDQEPIKKVGAGGTAPMGQGVHFASGFADFNAGKPRELPSYFTKTTGKNPSDWYRGWDSAKASAQPAPTIAGKPVTEMADSALERIADGKIASDTAKAHAEEELAKRQTDAQPVADEAPVVAENDIDAELQDVAEPETKQPESETKESTSASPVDTHYALMESLREGTANLADYKAGFEALLKSEAEIKAALATKTKDQLLKMGGPQFASNYKSDKKDRVVDGLYRNMVSDYSLHRGLTYVLSGRGDSQRNAVVAMVEGTSEETLKEFAGKVAEARSERAENREKALKAIEDPKTLDDFVTYIRFKKSEGMDFTAARMTLTPEQRALFDKLTAEQTRDARKARADQQKTDIRATSTTTDGQVFETKHTRTGEPLFVVKAAERVERDVYNQWNATAKKLGGWYSSYRGAGAIPGFQFKTRENADAFLSFLGGNTEQAKQVVQERRDAFADDKSQTAVERLNEMADRLAEKADESLGYERKANTDRRARFAAAAEAAANADKALAGTMRNIAKTIENGTAQFLDRVRQKSQVEMLRGFLSRAKDNELRAKYPTYAEQERHKGEPASDATADYADFPQYVAFRSDLANLGRQMLEHDGAKKLGASLLKVADDVTDAYLDFAKKNLHKVSTFKTTGGGDATFASRDDAETAIKRSGYKGKAIVLPFKRGQNIIILSPTAAKEKGIWPGDDDKRITLTAEFGAEIVAKDKELTRYRLSVPYTFHGVSADRARLSGMGIETPAEFRAALREFIAVHDAPNAPSRIKQLERAMVGRKNDGLDFFPTPASVADRMVEAAGIEEGMAVLEPSAGMGHIADRIAAAGADPDVVEMSADRRELLEAKGYRLVASDFMDMSPRGFTYGDVFRHKDGREGVMRGSGGLGSNRVGFIPESADAGQSEWVDREDLSGVRKSGSDSGYDRIIMNPPFSDRRDAEHVRHAYSMLRPGGRIVAIMGEGVFFGQDKKAQAFRDWLEEVGGTSEKLEDGTFLDPSLPVNTGVNARMVVIDKSKSSAMESRRAFKPVDTESAEFKRWFGGSKVVDADGKPLVVYHGTTADISEFDPSLTQLVDGVFLTPETGYASQMARGRQGAGNVLPLYVSLKNPGVIDTSKGDYYNSNSLNEAISDGKADGVIVIGEDGKIHVVIAIKPTQIKSAISNTGEFSDTNPDIRESRSADTDLQFAANVLGELSEQDEMFRFQVSSSSSLKTVFADVYLGSKYFGEHTRADERNETGADHRHVFINPQGARFYVYTTDDGRVWIDVSQFKRGDVGQAVYAAVANWAYNTKKRFVGDPAGLTVDSIIRRTSNMLSSALRFGTTRHLEAAPEQVKGDPDKGIEPLKWGANDVENFRELIHTFITTVYHQFPKLANYSYDFAKQGFFDKSGTPVTAGRFSAGAETTDAGRARAGEATLRRAVFLRSLVSSSGSERPGILEQILRRGRALVTDGDLRGLFSKTAPANAGVFVSEPNESARAIKAVVEKFKQQFAGTEALNIRVAKTVAEIPARFRPSRYAEGVFHDDAGLIYLVVENLKHANGQVNTGRAWQVLMHEAVGHFGLARMMGERFAGILSKVKAATKTKGEIRQEDEDFFYEPGHPDYATWDAVLQRYPEANESQIAQEVLARMAETDPGRTLFGYVRAVVRQWLRDMARAAGFDVSVSSAEMNDLVAQASAYMRRGDGLNTASMPSGTVAASKARGMESRAAAAASNQKPQGPIWNSPDESRADDLIYTLQDKHIDLKRVQDGIKKAIGNIRDDIDAYLQEELFHGRAAKATEEFLERELNPFIGEMKQRGISMESLENFLWVRHAKERNAQIAKINPDMPDGGSGLTNKQADDLLAGKDVTVGGQTIKGIDQAKLRSLTDLSKKVDMMVAGNRILLETYELETADTVAAWAAAYKHYVPLHREDADMPWAGSGTGQGYSVKGSSTKRATGSFRPVENILANLVLQRTRTITRGEKNRVAQAMYGLAKETPNPDFWSVDDAPTIRTVEDKAIYHVMDGKREVANFTRMGDAEKKARENPAWFVYQDRGERVVEKVDPSFRSKPNVVWARFNGEDRFVAFNERDPRALRAAESLKNLDADDISNALGEVARWTRYFSSINTQYNPIFGVLNLFRDVGTGILNLRSTPLEGKQADLLRNLYQALPSIYRAVRTDRKGGTPTGVWTSLWEEFQEVGGKTGYRDMFRNSHEQKEALAMALDPTWWQQKWWGKTLTVGGIFSVPEQLFVDAIGKPVFEWLSDYNTMMENGIRLSAYKLGLEQGMSKERAASLAKNLTVNFNRKGQIARQAGALYAFFNASVQGTARMAETMHHGAKPGEWLGKAGKQIVYGGMLLGAIQALALMAAGFDDDEPPEFVRDRNVVIPVWGGKYLTVPLPLGFHVLPALGRIGVEFTLGGFKAPGKNLAHVFDVVVDAFNPIGNAGMSMQTIAPTVLDPLAALAENKDWTGKPIAREDMSGLSPTPGHSRTKDTASALSKAISYGVNALSGGTEFKKGMFSPTPDQLDYLIGQVTGGVGRESLKLAQTVVAPFSGEELPPHKIPLVGRFYGDTTGQAATSGRFYNNLKALNEHQAEFMGMAKSGRREQADIYLKENPEAIMFREADRMQRYVSKLRDQKRELIKRDAKSEEIRAIEQRITQTMSDFNARVDQRKNPPKQVERRGMVKVPAY